MNWILLIILTTSAYNSASAVDRVEIKQVGFRVKDACYKAKHKLSVDKRINAYCFENYYDTK